MEEIKEVFGGPIYADRQLAPKAHSDLATLWEQILTKGLPDKTLVELMEKHPPPKNCRLFDAPKLNQLVGSIMQENILTRDKKIQTRQDLGSALCNIRGDRRYHKGKNNDRLEIFNGDLGRRQQINC